MIITCKACSTSFNLDDKMLKPTGSKVRCSVCASVFTAFPEKRPSAEPAADAVEPETAPPSEPADAMTAIEAHETEAGAEIADTVDDAMDEGRVGIAVESVSDSDVSVDADVADEKEATIIASLDDDDFDLDFSPETDEEEGSATVIADLDDDEFDLSFDEQPDMGETVIVDLDQEDFQLDVPPGVDDDQDSATVVITDLDDESLDLDDDFSLEAAEEPKISDATDEALMGEGDDLDLSLDLGPDDDALSADEAIPETTDDALDDLSLDFDLEADADAAEAESDAGGTVDDEMDLALDLDGGAGREVDPAEATVLEDDLDLSSLEGLLDDDASFEEDGVTMVVDEDESSDLTLELDDATPESGTVETGGPDETLADLEFELDEEEKSGISDGDDADSGEQEVDLSEIEKMLETPEIGGEKFSGVPEQDLDLDIEASLETEKWMSESGEGGPLLADEELDLSELEQVLEDVTTGGADDTPDDQELELDLEDGKPLGDPNETVAVDSELDFDLSDFEDDTAAKSDESQVSREPADMELEFEIEEDSQKEPAPGDENLEETVAIPEAKAEPTKEKPAEPAVAAAPVTKPKPVKKGMSKSLVFLLVIIILGGAGYGTYYLLNQSGIEIPFLSDYLKPKVQDPGNLKLTTYDINSKFVDNASVGKLFVISGKVKNGYPENRGMISLMGKIFSTGKVPVHQELVYCGNVMSDLELANLEWDKIKARLANRLGDNRSNVKIEPGKSISFMVVFSGLPDDLEEFTIEPVGSTSLK